MIIAVDLDGCISSYKEGWKGPDVFGPLVKDTRWALMLLHQAGHIIIVHTCRYLTEELRSFLIENGIWFDYVNEDAPNSYEDEYKEQGKDRGRRKVHADLYIDDRGYRFDGDWMKVLDFISSRAVIPWEGK